MVDWTKVRCIKEIGHRAHSRALNDVLKTHQLVLLSTHADR